MEEKVIISAELDAEDFSKDTKKLTQDIKGVSLEINKLAGANKSLKSEEKKIREDRKKGKITTDQMQKSLASVSSQMAKNTIQAGKLKTERKQLIKVQKEEAGSLNFLRAKLTGLKTVRDKVNLSSKEGRAEFEKQTKVINKLNSTVKRAEESGGDYQRSVGNYGKALGQSNPKIAAATNAMAKMKEGLIVTKVALMGTTKGLSGGSKALKIFKFALISTGIGAVVVALGALIAFLGTTQKGMDAVTKVTKPLKVIFGSILGVIQDLGERVFETGKKMLKALSKPKVLLQDLMEFIKNNVINRFKALGVIVQGLMNFDFKQMANGFLQLGSGVEDVIGKVGKIVDKVGEMAESTGEFFRDAIEKGGQLAAIAIEISEKETEIGLIRAKAIDDMKALELIAKDTSKSAEERNKAGNDALVISKDLAEKEKEILALKIKEMTLDQTINDTSREGIKELNQLKAEAVALDTANKAREMKFISVLGLAKKEADKKSADQAKKQEEINTKFREREAVAMQKLADFDTATSNKARLEATEGTATFFKIKQDIENEDFEKKKELIENELLTESEKKLALQELEIEHNEATNEINDENHELLVEQELERAQVQKDFETLNDENKIIALKKLNNTIRGMVAISEKEKRDIIAKNNKDIVKIEKDAADEIKKTDDEVTEQKKKNREAGFKLLTQIVGAGLELEQRKIEELKNKNNKELANDKKKLDEQIANLKDKLDKGLIDKESFDSQSLVLQGKFDDKKDKLDRDVARKEHALKVKQFRADQAQALIDIAIATAVGIANAFKKGIFIGGASAIIITAGNLVQAGLVAIKSPPTLEQGGPILKGNTIKGKSHTQGGIDLHLGGKLVANVQGDEGLYILKKEAQIKMLEERNMAEGGRSFGLGRNGKMQEGGRIDTSDDIQLSATDIAIAISNVTLSVEIMDYSPLAILKLEGAVKEGYLEAIQTNTNII